MAVGTNTPVTALCQIIDAGENTVAQIRFCCGAQPGNRTALRHAGHFFLIRMCRVDKTPAGIDIQVIIQPRNGALSAPAQAVIDFFLLLGDMDMYRQCRVAGL